jgi:acetyltransferase-like isoleucine patch superfamily enzyme
MSAPETKQSSVQRLLAAVLGRIGKDYEPARDLPAGLVVNVLRIRFAWLVRGSVRFHRPVFVGPQVKVRGKRHIELGRASTVERGVVLDGYAKRGIRIGPRSRIGAHTIVSCTSHLSRYGEGFSIGCDSGIGEHAYVGAAGGVTIGDNVIMGQFVTFHSQEHEFDDITKPIRLQNLSERGITIEQDCWVGARVTFLDGTHVAEGSVVAAGAVVKGPFPPRSVIGGIPARVLRTRGDAQT